MSNRLSAVLALTVAAALPADAVDAGFDEAMAHYEKADFAAAAAEFQALVENDPSYDYGHFMLGVCRFRENNFDVAIDHLRRAIELESGRFAYHNALATALARTRDYQAAVAALDRAEELAASDAELFELRKNRGAALAQLGRCAEAVRDLGQTVNVRPSSGTLLQLGICQLRLGSTGDAIATLEQAARTDARGTASLYLADAYLRKARDIASEGPRRAAFRTAADHARAATGASPNDASAWNRLGQAEMGARQLEQAAAAFQRALQLRADDCHARINLGRSQLGLGRWHAASRALTRARRCAPQSGTVLEALAFAKLKLGELNIARTLYQQAIAKGAGASARDGLAAVTAKLDQRAAEAEVIAEERRAEEEMQRRLSEYEEKRKAYDGDGN